MYSAIRSLPHDGEYHGPLDGTNLPGDACLVLTTDPKPRLRWTAELHERFVDAVTQLGGPEKATPKTIMRTMGVKGLTLYSLHGDICSFGSDGLSENDGEQSKEVKDPKNQGDETSSSVAKSLSDENECSPNKEVVKARHQGNRGGEPTSRDSFQQMIVLERRTLQLVSLKKWNIEMLAITPKFISILSVAAGLGMTMFSLGLFMVSNPIIVACGNRRASFAAFMRFLAGPAVMIVASYAVGLQVVLLNVAIIRVFLSYLSLYA